MCLLKLGMLIILFEQVMQEERETIPLQTLHLAIRQISILITHPAITVRVH